MNTPPLAEPLPHVLHVPKTSDPARKSAFIRTCDAMLHARSVGETFGLAIAEFSAHDRPVLTSSVHHDAHTARMHLDTLGEKGLYYHDTKSLVDLLVSFDRTAAKKRRWNAYRAFEPQHVMATFDKVFVRGRSRRDVPDWKRWRHGGARGGGGADRAAGDMEAQPRRRPTADERKAYEAWHEEQRQLHADLGRLRGLPPEPERPLAQSATYRVVGASAALRLAPSTSAGSVAPPLRRGDTCRVEGMRGDWVRLAPAAAAPPSAATAALPCWMLTRHPEEGVIAEPV